MVLLEIYIPENWPPEPGASESGEPLWQLREAHGRIARAGRGLPDTLAHAGRCRLILPAGRVTLSQLRLPAQNRKKFMQALAFAVEDRIMADPESVHVASGPVQESGDMSVAIVERAWLRRVLDTLRASGLQPGRAETEIHCVPLEEKEWGVVWRGHGGFLCQGAHHGMVLDGGSEQEPPLGLRLAVGESGVKPASIRVHTDQADLPDMAQWALRLGVPVKPGGQWERGVATGGIDLLQGDFAPASPVREWLPRLRPALVLAGVLVATHIVFSVVDWTVLRHEKKTLLAGMELGFRSAFPGAKVVVDAPLQMSRNLAGLRHAAGQPDPGDFMPLLASVAPLLGNDARVRHLEYHAGSLKVGLQLPGAAALDALRTRLQILPQAHLDGGPAVGAGLEAQLTVNVP